LLGRKKRGYTVTQEGVKEEEIVKVPAIPPLQMPKEPMEFVYILSNRGVCIRNGVYRYEGCFRYFSTRVIE